MGLTTSKHFDLGSSAWLHAVLLYLPKGGPSLQFGRLTVSMRFLAVLERTLEPYSSISSSILGTKKRSSGSYSQWLSIRRALAAPEVHLLSSSAKPKLSEPAN
ncbi:hypothetical protein ACOSQ4_010068 [Xanthoceras sorbifolium]